VLKKSLHARGRPDAEDPFSHKEKSGQYITSESNHGMERGSPKGKAGELGLFLDKKKKKKSRGQSKFLEQGDKTQKRH